jgi:hypothetical protein
LAELLTALMTNVKRAPLADYRVVYFATPALVAGDIKGLGEPALLLSLPKKPNDFDDGLLTASEVARNYSSMPIGWCFPPATRRPARNPAPKLFRASRARSFMRAPARYWSRIGRSIRQPLCDGSDNGAPESRVASQVVPGLKS